MCGVAGACTGAGAAVGLFVGVGAGEGVCVADGDVVIAAVADGLLLWTDATLG